MRARLGRLVAALGIALVLAVPAVGAAPAPGGGDNPAVQFAADVRAARDALPADPVGARAALDRAAALARDPSILDPARTALDGGDTARARSRLDDIVGVLSLPANATPGDISDARGRLAAVYARPPLDRLDRPNSSGGWSNPFTWFYDRLADLLNGADRSLGTPGKIALGTAAMALVLLVVLRRLRTVSAGRLLRAAPDDPGDASADAEEEWRAADEAARRGDLREAVRRAFRSALLAIALAGRVPVDAAWTTRELLAAASADADVLAALAPAAAAFDLAWYGGRLVGPADWEAQRQRCATLRRLAGRGSAAGAPALERAAP